MTQSRAQSQPDTLRQQSLVTRPEQHAGRKLHRSQQVRVDISNAGAKKCMARNEMQNFLIGGVRALRQAAQGIQDGSALLQTAQCEFADHQSMRQHLGRVQQLIQFSVAMAQMVYPDRGIHQNHAASVMPAPIGALERHRAKVPSRPAMPIVWRSLAGSMP